MATKGGPSMSFWSGFILGIVGGLLFDGVLDEISQIKRFRKVDALAREEAEQDKKCDKALTINV
jgi:hypothetical protein